MSLNNLYYLSTGNYENYFEDDEGQCIGVLAYENIPTVNIGAALQSYLMGNDLIVSIFNEINYYARTDYPQRSLQTLNIFTEKVKQFGSFGTWTGKFILEAVFPLLDKRYVVPEEIQRATDYLTLVLNGTDCLNFVSQYATGTVTLAFNNDWNFIRAQANEAFESQDCYIAKAIGEYTINILQYYESLYGGETYEGFNLHVNLAQ